VDLERRQPVIGLAGRTAEPLIKWLQDHPTVAILVRHRANAYALAGRMAAPDALQVADRFHLIRNVSAALKALLQAHRWHPPATGSQPEATLQAATTTVNPAETPLYTPLAQATPRKRGIWEAVQQRWSREQSLRQIARALGLDRRPVRPYVAPEQPLVYPPRRPRPTQLTPYLSYLAERWAQGVP
jgi:hypothetical protein